MDSFFKEHISFKVFETIHLANFKKKRFLKAPRRISVTPGLTLLVHRKVQKPPTHKAIAQKPLKKKKSIHLYSDWIYIYKKVIYWKSKLMVSFEHSTWVFNLMPNYSVTEVVK